MMRDGLGLGIFKALIGAYSVILKLQTSGRFVSSSAQCWRPLRRDIAVRRTEAASHLNMTRNCEEIIVMNLK